MCCMVVVLLLLFALRVLLLPLRLPLPLQLLGTQRLCVNYRDCRICRCCCIEGAGAGRFDRSSLLLCTNTIACRPRG